VARRGSVARGALKVSAMRFSGCQARLLSGTVIVGAPRDSGAVAVHRSALAALPLLFVAWTKIDAESFRL
jgi:hypothetical protein